MSPSQIKKDPVGSLIAKIANAKVEIHRARTAYQLWSKRGFQSVQSEVNKTVIKDGVNAKTGRISVVQESTMEAFLALPPSERQVWELRAEGEKKANAEAREALKNGIIPPQCLDPEETQEYVLFLLVLSALTLLQTARHPHTQNPATPQWH